MKRKLFEMIDKFDLIKRKKGVKAKWISLERDSSFYFLYFISLIELYLFSNNFDKIYEWIEDNN